MNIEKGFSSESEISSNDVIDRVMTQIHDILIEPMEHKLTDEEHSIVTLIGVALQIMAEKATLYEQSLENQPFSTNNETFYRN